MRVCFVSRRFFPAISGMSVYAENLLRELVAAGHDVTMISQFRGDEEGTRIYGGGPPPPVPGVTVAGREAVGEQSGGDFERDVDDLVAQVLARGPFDVVHAQYGYPTGIAAMEAARRLGVPSVVSIQGGDGHWVGDCCATHMDAMRIVCAHAGKLLIGSGSFRDEVVERVGADAERFSLVPGAVDTTRFVPAPQPEPGGGRTLLYHGRVDRRKGILDLIAALPEVPGARLVVSGIGPDLEPARQAARGLPVEFLGYVPYDEVPGVYPRADVFVSPTYAEGFSNTVLEAMACGLPVVAGRAVGVVDCVRDGENGLLHEPGDVAGLALLLRRITADAALRARLRAAALEEVRATYAWPRVAALIQDAYAAAPADPGAVRWEVPRARLPCRFRQAPHLL